MRIIRNAAAADVAILKGFQEHDIPVFFCRVRQVDGRESGFPTGWQHTAADQYDVDNHGSATAFCVVTGHGVDVVDVDPRNGGDPVEVLGWLFEANVPLIASVATPDGGMHFYIPSTGMRRELGIWPGVDFLGGTADGQGRSFAYAPGTHRPKYPSKGYTWIKRPDWSLLSTGVEEARAFVTSLRSRPDPQVMRRTHLRTSAPSTNETSPRSDTTDDPVSRVTQAVEGSRNSTLFTEVAALASDNRLTHDLQRRLSVAALRAGLTNNEVDNTIRSAITLGHNRRARAEVWYAAALASPAVSRSRGISMKLTVNYFRELFAHHGEEVGLSCRTLARVINTSPKTANKCLRRLVGAGLLAKVDGKAGKSFADRYRMPLELDSSRLSSLTESVETEEGQGKETRRKGNSQIHTTYVSSSSSTHKPVDCNPSDAYLDHLAVIAGHDVFTRVQGGVCLPAGAAVTLLALDVGLTTVKSIAEFSGTSPATVRGHVHLLKSAGFVTYSKHEVSRTWSGDLGAALDAYAASMGLTGRAEQRTHQFTVDREHFTARAQKPPTTAPHEVFPEPARRTAELTFGRRVGNRFNGTG